MQNSRILSFMVAGVTAALSLGCNGGDGPIAASDQPPAFEPGDVKLRAAQVAYPEGPYGVHIGSTVTNYRFMGFPDPTKDKDNLEPLQLADFYNPHGLDPSYQPASPEEDDRLFPSNSLLGRGEPKPVVLLIVVSCVWCGPCNDEAKYVMPPQHKLYAPCGGEFLLNLADGAEPGVEATTNDLHYWVKGYKIDYPSVIDPSSKLSPLFAVQAYPANVIVDTTTMKVVASMNGAALVKSCGDFSSCDTDAECAQCYSYDGGHVCGDGSPCTKNADCAGLECSLSDFWTKFEEHLDKGREGCTLE